MKIPFLFITLISMSAVSVPTSAHFFPNISSLPTSLIENVTLGAWNSFQKLGGCHIGQKVDGLAKLKKYFEYFGYMGENLIGNFTDDFDDVLESAIKTYQMNFNLNVTGDINNQTLKHIVRPRCGVADIINGSSTMNSGKPSRSTHLHTVSHYSFFPGRPRWPSGQSELSYAFLPQNQLTASSKAVFARAFSKWSEVTPLRFIETTSFTTADIRIGFFRGDHGDGEPFDGAFGTLAHAFSPPSGRFHLDLDENWVIDGRSLNSAGNGAFDLESVAVHEIGHLLGLGHSSVEESIMFPTLSSGTRKLTLAGDDVAGIQELYGSNPNLGSTVAAPAGREMETSGTYVPGPVSKYAILFVVSLLSFVL